MIYVYAITDAGCAAPLDVRGLDDQPVTWQAAGNLAGACSALPQRHVDPSAEQLWRHETVVESIMRRCDAVLPVRFGMMFDSEAALAEVLARHAASLATGLDRVRGCVEMGLRVMRRSADDAGSPPRPSNHSDRSGRAYMLARLEDERRRRAAQAQAEQIGQALNATLAPLAHDTTRRILPAPRVLLTAAYLVSRDQVESFTARARALAGDHPDLRITCTGPWPTYHFSPALESTEAAHA